MTKSNRSQSASTTKSSGSHVQLSRAATLKRPAIPGNLYSGPDNTRNHRVRRLDDRYVGEGETTPERTSQIDYITRGPSSAAFHRPRHERIGEIGWTVNFYNTCRGL